MAWQHGLMAQGEVPDPAFDPLVSPEEWVLVGADPEHAVPVCLPTRHALIIEDDGELSRVRTELLARGRPLLARLPGEPWRALGVTLALRSTSEGGRRKPIIRKRYAYRPNWGLPGMEGTDQVGAPLLWMGKEALVPGATARAVIIPLVGNSLRLWRLVESGDELRMFEGAKVCGTAQVEWSEQTEWPLPPEDEERFVRWCDD